LATVASELDARGCSVVISNADHPTVRELYPEFRYEVVERPSRISASAQHRRQVTEAVIHNGGIDAH
jgi:DNA adenine methylase